MVFFDNIIIPINFLNSQFNSQYLEKIYLIIMSKPIEEIAFQQLASLDLTPYGRVHPSPNDWRDQIIYFLLPDRFSDGMEDSKKQFDLKEPDKFKTNKKRKWMDDGNKFQGGTLKGIKSKLDYLHGLGVKIIWIGPIFQQRRELETYHGYAIQNFLDIDTRFGTRQDLRDLVDSAHDRGMYVILDIIYNHTGNNWFYADENTGKPRDIVDYRFQPPYPADGWRSQTGESISEINTLEDGVWPKEFQNFDWYTRAGQIVSWDPKPWENPMHPDAEFRRGDFFALKDINLSQNEVLDAVVKVYQYWIALSDCDGFRIDAVKHIPLEISRNFCGAIREYTESIGKENFLLLGEVTGGAEMARNYLEIFGLNLDVVIDVGEPTKKLAEMISGLQPPKEFFAQFDGHNSLGCHREIGRYHVSILDDHDMVGRNYKQRFAANNNTPEIYQQVAHAVGVQLTTLGIPCIYYGTEQAFDGTEYNHDFAIEPELNSPDRYIRESMFGSTFGAFETSNCHFFNPNHPTYLRIAAIARIRNQENCIGKTLRRGRQYLRDTSFLGRPFSIPENGELVAWSRILFNKEVLVILNTHNTESRAAEVNVDFLLHPPGSKMTFLYRGDWSIDELVNTPQNQIIEVQEREQKAIIEIFLPPAGMAILT